MTHREKAIENFYKGYNCAQSVLLAFCDVTGLDEETAERLAAYAEQISSSPYLTSDYLDYLRQKEDQYK